MSYFQKENEKKEIWTREYLDTYIRALRALGRTEQQIKRELKEQIRAVEEQEEKGGQSPTL